MSNFTAQEIEYLRSQRLGRLATLSAMGEPHVVPVGFRYNAELDTIDIGGHNIGKSKKFRDVARDGRVAFVVDDVLPPWKPRGVEVRGLAEVLAEGGKQIMQEFDDELIRITPRRIISWGVESDAFRPNSRGVE
ncbi:MAG TPA: PPOX class F420-dependent oxidoreductase [Ktedonobacterales bacterium]|jgi:pyridoxamine 5'-phosphate oxidase family protein